MSTKRSTSGSLDSLRGKIDQIDGQILDLINRRARLAQQIGQAKQQDKAVTYVPSRERTIIARLSQMNLGPLSDSAVEAIYGEIISASRALEQLPKICYFGPATSYARIAAREQFGTQAELFPAETITKVFSEVENGRAHYGVVPIENSGEGVVVTTVDAFIESPLCIIAERSVEVLKDPNQADDPNLATNVTRFVVVGHAQQSQSTGQDKTVLFVSVRGQVGALYALGGRFADNAIGVERVESRRRKGKPEESLFFIDLEGHMSDPLLVRSIEELERVCTQVKILGSYATAKRATMPSRQTGATGD